MEKEQIVKELEGLSKFTTCPDYIKRALSLILEQEKRIEYLETICESYAIQYGTAADKEVFLKQERADTVRKMQKMLKEKAMDVDMDDATLWMSCVPVDDIDQIVNKLLEEKT